MGRAVRWLITLAIIALLVLFASKVDWTAAWVAIRNASPALLAAAFVANAITLVARAVRWWIFLRAAGAPSLWLAVRASLAGAALNNLLLAQGGEAARVVFVSRASSVPAATVLATLALERLFDVVAFVVLLAVGTLFLPLPPELAAWRIPAAIQLVVVAVLLVLFVRMTRGKTIALAAEATAEVAVGHANFLARGKQFVRRFARSASGLASGPRFVAAFAVSVVAWAGQIYTYHWCAVAIGIELPIAASIAALLAANIGFLVRVTPGSVGVFQVIYVVTVARFAVAREPAVAAALLIQTLQIVPLTLIGAALAPEFVFRRKPKTAAEA